MTDPLLINDWHPIACSENLVPGQIARVTLLGQDIALWRSADGAVHAWEDRCPHRGMRLSASSIVEDAVVCAYHGWRFGPSGQCSHIPAHPGFTPTTKACARTYAAIERYGLVWACLGNPAQDVLPFPEYADTQLRKVICGPYDVAASGPRIVENFIDMAHFAYVHGGILGDADHAEVPDYVLADFDDGGGHTGVLATQCFAWQPRTNSLSDGGSMVEYTYRIVRPLSAILTKLPQAQQDFREAISLHIQPVSEESSRAWIILAMTNFVHTEEELRAFQDRIFLQDLPILENQVPRKLPLAPTAELPVRCDRMSQAYRRYLTRLGLRYGVIPA